MDLLLYMSKSWPNEILGTLSTFSVRRTVKWSAVLAQVCSLICNRLTRWSLFIFIIWKKYVRYLDSNIINFQNKSQKTIVEQNATKSPWLQDYRWHFSRGPFLHIAETSVLQVSFAAAHKAHGTLLQYCRKVTLFQPDWYKVTMNQCDSVLNTRGQIYWQLVPVQTIFSTVRSYKRRTVKN